MLAGKKRVPWLTKTPASIKKPAVEKSINNGTTAAAASGDADCGVSGFCYQITNPQSPLGSQHCQELDNPGGKASKYWADRGWKYTSPPWKNGTCDRNQFNYVAKVTHNLDGYDGVIALYLGRKVSVRRDGHRHPVSSPIDWHKHCTTPIWGATSQEE